MSTATTPPRVRLSLREFLDLLLGVCAVAGAMLGRALAAPPWHALAVKARRGAPEPERKEQGREYWRRVCAGLVRAGGGRLSIRQLQYLMPGTARMARGWSHARRVGLNTDVVRSPLGVAPAVHWVGGCPSERGIEDRARVLLWVHGGGFVLPMSHGHLDLLWYIRERLTRELSCTVYIAAVEYSIAPYARHPVQLEQVIRSLFYLLEKYTIPPSSLILAGDSCGGALCISTLSHLLHPHPSISVPQSPHASPDRPLLPSPLAGVLLLSPWTSFATTAASYRENRLCDSLTPCIVRRFRGAYLSGTDALPATREADAWAYASATGGDSGPPAAAARIEDDPVLSEPWAAWNGDTRRGYWLQAAEAPVGWWAGIEDVASRVMITAGVLECFRDDILAFEATLRTVTKRDGSGPALEVGSFLDHAVHATLVSDFAFGVEPGEQMERVITWLKQTFRSQA